MSRHIMTYVLDIKKTEKQIEKNRPIFDSGNFFKRLAMSADEW